uniref:Mannosyltransferase n=1 Tax=Moina brachiata TaxID=675436 RepID=A0A4Y7NIB4_9CRUS|nr:EOG090X04MD [Moina brachiata]SVE92959.1 EOG090X04MD [Moina brachiata]
MLSRIDALLVVTSLVHLLLCPFTKVEESFNLQAVHDILYNRANIEEYDHLEFPGVVPRTFLGPLVVSAVSAPFVALSSVLGFSKFVSLYIVRSAIGCLVLLPLIKLRKRVAAVFGHETSVWFVLVTISQFHFMYYLSRPLPNTMALPLVLLAFNYWLEQKHGKFIVSSAAAIIIFRGELAILLGLILMMEIIMHRVSIKRVLLFAVPSGVLWISFSVLTDSIFWQRILWPEGEVLWFNVILNKSSDWGTLPFLWYFYSAIPRAMGTSLALLPLGMILERRLFKLMLPPFLFVLAYSLLPHKELRFIIYVVPLFNVSVAILCNRFWSNRAKSKWHTLLALGVIAHLVANFVLTGFLATVSRANYPGGEALKLLHELEGPEASVSVHIDNFAAQTGVSRFGQLHAHWRYDKTENLKPGCPELRLFTHLIVEAKSKHAYSLKPYSETHDIIGHVDSFSHIRSSYNHFPPIRIKFKPALFVLKNKKPPLLPDFSVLVKRSVQQEEAVTEAVEQPPEELPVIGEVDSEFSNHVDAEQLIPGNQSEVVESAQNG